MNQMKKYLFLALLALTANNSFAVDKEPIVDVNVVEEFGIWRIYNSGDNIYIVDSLKGRIIRAGDNGYFNYHPLEGGVYSYSPSNDGTSSISSSSLDYPQSIANIATTTTVTAHLQNGIFGFEESNFQVDGDTLFIYDEDNYNGATKDASLKMVLNKFSNRVLVEGSKNTSNFEPTIVVSADDITGPAKILGD